MVMYLILEAINYYYYQAVHVFRRMIKRMMPDEEDAGKRRGRAERTRTLNVIHKVLVTHMINIIFSHNLGDSQHGIPVCAAASDDTSQEGLRPTADM